MLKPASLVLAAVSLAACAEIPEVQYQYYQPKSATVLSVTQTLQCVKNPASKSSSPTYLELDVATSVATPTTYYSSDFDEQAPPIDIEGVDGPLSDSDTGFTFTEDGRLAGINATTTGEGQAILTAAINLGTAIVMLDRFQIPHAGPSVTDICKTLASWPNADKLALTFTRVVDLGAAAQNPAQRSFTLNDDEPANSVSDQDLYAFIKKERVTLPAVAAVVGDVRKNARVATYKPASSDEFANLQLQDTASVRIDYQISSKTIGASSSVVVVPLKGSFYPLPIPKAEPFGNTKVVLVLTPSGAITSLEYGKTNGAAGALTVASTAATAAKPAPPPPAQ